MLAPADAALSSDEVLWMLALAAAAYAGSYTSEGYEPHQL